MLVSPFRLSLFPPPLLLLPFPHPLYVDAKLSNGCWHILEPCCPTHSLSCAGQVRGSTRYNLAVDETNTQKQLARPPTIASRAAHLFPSQVKSGGLFISSGAKPSPSEGFRSANARHLRCRRTEKKTDSEQSDRAVTMPLPPHTDGAGQS